MSTIAHARSHAVTHAWRGVVAGIAGGIVFGILMAMMGMLTTIAMLVGGGGAVVGGLVHLVISAGIGLVFGLLAGSFADRLWPVLGAGLVYGLAWWVLGGLVLMPAMLGMPMFQLNQAAMMSLVGHAVYGLVAAGALYGLSRREV
ncbi:putative membrane protein YagU involved in acid resistance [Spinactinospora alkalitolerans]|uniref:Putative membrane protein YagU involved in acid resistance n=1 Tax=Spinactinospora alkalitolerans TaxID=687207 RepID=A0A852TXV3_9ACTN|nr:hypothetical protein [Spinactinospora alkalitolerans]NYE48117.1 putative membrane protein YagU involved in acid resistance [Spinactinospora alkalitolerans]